MIVAFTWTPRRGKWLLCISLLASFIASVGFRVLDLLAERDLLNWRSATMQTVSIIGGLLYWTSNILLLCFVIVARKAFWSAKSGDLGMSGTSAASEAVDPRMVGIGGWLILPAIGLVLGGIMSVVGLIACVGMFEGVADAGYGGYFALSICVQIGLLIFLLVAAIRFFGKKRSAPATMIGLMIANLVSSLLLMLFAFGMDAEEFAVADIKNFATGLVSSAIWIPYFLTSKRVKATFVNGPASYTPRDISAESEQS